ncbi:MAG: hypothetical protein ACOCZ5_03530 [bacterium]
MKIINLTEEDINRKWLNGKSNSIRKELCREIMEKELEYISEEIKLISHYYLNENKKKEINKKLYDILKLMNNNSRVDDIFYGLFNEITNYKGGKLK